MYSLAVNHHAPKFMGDLNRHHVPWVAVLLTSAISGLCFGASYIGAGQLWTWLQNIVGVSNQLSWIAIGFASLRFRAGLRKQGLEHLLPFNNWTYPYGPVFSVGLNSFLVLVQGWSCFSPTFKPVDFVSYYVQLPVLGGMLVAWKLVKRTKWVKLEEMDLVSDRYDTGFTTDEREKALDEAKFSNWKDAEGWKAKSLAIGQWLFL